MIACLLDTRKLHPETSGTWLPKHDLGNDTTGRHANPGGGNSQGTSFVPEELQEVYICWKKDNLLPGPPTDRLVNPKRSVLNTSEQY